jgi:hypothetical protein
MITLLRAPLPAGLRAVARKDHAGHLVVTVSSSLAPAQQRAAVREVRRAAGRKGWLPGIIVPVAAAAIRAGKHPAALAIGGAGAVIGTAAALAIMVSPGLPGLHPVQELHRTAPAPAVAVARPHVHRRRQDRGTVSVMPPARHVTLPASAPAPAALARAPSLLEVPLPRVHVKIQVKVAVPPLPLLPSLPVLPVPLPSPSVGACLNLHLPGSGACVNVAA